MHACRQAPLSMRFSRQVYWSGFLCPPPGDLPDPGIEPTSSALQVDSLPQSHQGSWKWKYNIPKHMECSESSANGGNCNYKQGFSSGARGKEFAFQCRRCKWCGFNPCTGKIPWRRKWQTTPAFLTWRIPWTEEPGGLQPRGHKRDGDDWVRAHTHTHTAINTLKIRKMSSQQHIFKI